MRKPLAVPALSAGTPCWSNSKSATTETMMSSSKVRAKMVLNDTEKTFQSLLTQPEIRAKHYLFHDDNPFAPPPEEPLHVADLNTGKNCCAAWHDLIVDPTKQILLPIVTHMDGSQTGVWVDLELTHVKMPLAFSTVWPGRRPNFGVLY